MNSNSPISALILPPIEAGQAWLFRHPHVSQVYVFAISDEDSSKDPENRTTKRGRVLVGEKVSTTERSDDRLSRIHTVEVENLAMCKSLPRTLHPYLHVISRAKVFLLISMLPWSHRLFRRGHPLLQSPQRPASMIALHNRLAPDSSTRSRAPESA